VSRAVLPDPLPVLPPALRRPVAVVAVLAALGVVVLGVLFAGDSVAGWVDRAVMPWAESSTRSTTGWWLAESVDLAGEPVGLALLCALLAGIALLLRRPRVAALVVLGTGLSISVTSALKPLTGRMIHGDNLSYPSGHAASATALAMIAVLLVSHRVRRDAALALLYGAALMAGAAAAWAQVGLAAHYPTDTVGGWCTALAVVPAAAWLIDQTTDRLTTRRPPPTPGSGTG
jgi:undecaprenyl-diphosphatase